METKKCTKCKRVLEATTELFRVHPKGILGLQARCRECERKADAEYRRTPKGAEARRAYEQTDKVKTLRADYAKTDKRKKSLKSYRQSDAGKAVQKKATVVYKEKHRGEVNARKMLRHAEKLQRTPAWADLEAITAIYNECKQRTLDTGIPHEVDHIYPLRGKHVSGLHVENNLQILTRSENRRKSNN